MPNQFLPQAGTPWAQQAATYAAQLGDVRVFPVPGDTRRLVVVGLNDTPVAVRAADGSFILPANLAAQFVADNGWTYA